MAKAQGLTAEEMAGYRPHPELLRYILQNDNTRTDSRPLRVLDWGCGRGRLVAVLLEMGIDAYGVDVDANTLNNGRSYLNSLKKNGADRLRCIGARADTDFPDGYFDVVVSDNVLEHVADLDAVIGEIARVTRSGGWGFHLFPPRFAPMEGHLFMPFVHWLPKNGARRLAIRCYVSAGVEPHWPETGTMTKAEKSQVYFEYSRDKTFYRPPRTILALLRRHGLTARLVGLDHPRIRRHGLLSTAARSGAGGLLQLLIAELKTVELFVEKSAA